MARQEHRRINPIAHIALIAVAVLILFEVLVISGALELKAQTVAKYAPWAYEPFLRLVGEHPESAPRWAIVEEANEEEPAASAVAGVTGLEPSAIPVLIETNEAVLSTNLILEATVPLKTDSGPAADEAGEPEPVG